MSSLLFFASDKPFRELPNPHRKVISINEAIALGVKIPDYALEMDLDRDKPILLYMDRELHFNTETKELEDGDFDDDFAIHPFSPAEVFEIYTQKPYCARLEWHRYTDGRAENILAYIREHLQTAEDMEIWHGWLDDAETPVFKKKTFLLSELTAELLKALEEAPVSAEPMAHYCYIIRKA